MSAPAAWGGSEEPQEDGPRRFLIATAVSRYPKCPQWDRPGLVEARERIIGLFTRKLGYQHQTALGLDPTRSQLTDQLRAFCKSADRREDDLLAVYLSGHGEILDDGEEHVLLTADTDPDDIAYTALPTVELARAMLRDTPLRRLLLILDTCYSGRGGNELAATALQRLSSRWSQATGSGLVIVASAQPHQQAVAGVFPHLLTEAVNSPATAGHGPGSLSVSAVVQHMNDHPDRPGHQRTSLTLVGLTGEPPAFLVNPRHSTALTGVDLAVQQAAEFDEQTRQRDTELTRRLLVRAMGYHGDGARSWWFCGRRQALADLSAWLNSPATDGSSACRVVTAGPGSGKTAVLGLIAALSHPERRRTVPVGSLDLDSGLLPAENALDVAVYAQNLTDTDVLNGLAAAAGVQAGTVGEFLEALEARGQGRPFTALIDALDEADTPDTLCSRILRPLIEHSRGRVRLLLGTRPYLLDRIGLTLRNPAYRTQVIDLDDPRYADPEALRAYTVRNLIEARRTSPYRHCPSALRPVAEAIADAAGTSFLVARLAAGTLAAADEVVQNPWSPAWRSSLPRHAGQAMRDDLTGRLGADGRRAEDLLRPLAFALGQGLPWEDVWAPLASAVSGRSYTDEDLVWLRRTAGSYVVEATESGRSAYRLYHQSLAEYLREGTDARAVHAAFTDVLTDRVPFRSDAGRDWSRAHPYVLNYLAFHAGAGGRLDDVLSDAEYLVHAKSRGLAPQLHHARGESARLTAAVYRTSLGLHAGAPPAVRRQSLALDAARAGAGTLHRQLTLSLPAQTWTPRWATGSGFSPALRDTLSDAHESFVNTVACTVLDATPVAVTGGRDSSLRVWDLRTGTQMGPPLTARTGSVNGVACTTVGATPVAVAGGNDSRVRMWDLTTGAPVGQPLAGHADAVLTVACTVVDGTPVAVTGSRDATARVWDLSSGRQTGAPLAGHRGPVSAVACTEVDGTPVAVTGSHDGTVRMWDLRTSRPIGPPLTGHGDAAFGDPVYAVACMDLDGTPVAVTGGRVECVRMWDLRTWRPVGAPWTGHTDVVLAAACTVLDGTPIVVTGSADETVRVWDPATGAPIGRPLTGHTNWVRTVACTVLDGTPVVVTGSHDESVRVWEPTLRPPVGDALPGHANWARAAACTVVNGTPVAVTGGHDATARIWDLASGSPVGEPLTGHMGAVNAVACTEVNGTPVAVTAGADAQVCVWDLATGTLRGSPMVYHLGAVTGVACTVLHGAPIAVTCSVDHSIRMWDLETGAAVGEPLVGNSGFVNAVACALVDGSPVAVAAGAFAEVRVWDLATGTLRSGPLTDHRGPIYAAACMELDGVPVALTGSHDATVRLWDLRTCTPFGPPLTGHAGSVLALACTVLDGVPVVVTVSADETVKVWNLRTRRPSASFPVIDSEAVAFAADGHLVVCTGQDVAVFTQNLRPAPTAPPPGQQRA
jgi:WD40 repeat protein